MLLDRASEHRTHKAFLMIGRVKPSRIRNSARTVCMGFLTLVTTQLSYAAAAPPSQRSNADALAALIELADQRPDISADNWNSPEEFDELYGWLCEVLDELDNIVAASERAVGHRDGRLDRTSKTNNLRTNDAKSPNLTPTQTAQTNPDSSFVEYTDGSIFFSSLVHDGLSTSSMHDGIDLMIEITDGSTPASENINRTHQSGGIAFSSRTQGSTERVGRFVKPFVNTWYFDWPWVARDGQNMFLWVVGPPVGAATVLSLGFVLFTRRPSSHR